VNLQNQFQSTNHVLRLTTVLRSNHHNLCLVRHTCTKETKPSSPGLSLAFLPPINVTRPTLTRRSVVVYWRVRGDDEKVSIRRARGAQM
jgi:hypothetical protein